MFQGYPIESETLVSELLRSFEARIPAWASGAGSSERWTQAVNAALRDIGAQRGLRTYSSAGVMGFGEFLVDVMWWNPIAFRPEAVFEAEWGTVEDVLHGFEKLLYLKAPLKVMFCDPQREPERLLPEITGRFLSYPGHLKGERYVIMNVRGNPAGGNPECHEWNAPGFGAVKDVSFSAVPGSPFAYILHGGSRSFATAEL